MFNSWIVKGPYCITALLFKGLIIYRLNGAGMDCAGSYSVGPDCAGPDSTCTIVSGDFPPLVKKKPAKISDGLQ